MATKDTQNLDIYVSWKNLNFTVSDPKDKKKTKVILNDLNGCVKYLVKPGELVAVIGPSGSGKSSFLNCVSGRNIEGVTGDILFNEVTRPVNFARFTGYVIQDDMYFESLTVMETFKFTAALKLPTSFSAEDRTKRINDIIEELDLQKCQNTIIGTIGNGISGGERRRLAIGLEIINKPSLLLLDEPTSGLDSASALMVGKILKRLATTRNITILCTVHQPRFSLACMFDKLYFLGKGHELYFGPSFSKPDCLQFFEDAGYKCPEYENPADFLLDLVNTHDEGAADGPTGNPKDVSIQLSEYVGSDGGKPTLDSVDSKSGGAEAKETEQPKSEAVGDNGGDSDSRTAVIMRLAEAYQQSEYRKQALDYEVPASKRGEIIFNKITTSFYITPWYNQMWVITKRTFIHKLREPAATMTQAFNAILLPLLFGSVYWQMDLTAQSMYDRVSAIALMVLCLAFFHFDIIMLFPIERNIFNREQASGMYRPISFFVGRSMAETPQHAVFVWILGTIAYWMFGLQNDAEKYLIWMLIVESMVVSAAGLLMAFGAFARNLEQANLLATFFLIIFMLFDGNWVSLDKVPVYWRWIEHVSCLGYASQAAIANEYRGITFTCSQSEIDAELCWDLNGVSGETVIAARGMGDVDIYYNIVMLWVLAFAYRVLAFLGFWLFFRPMSPKQIIKNTFGL